MKVRNIIMTSLLVVLSLALISGTASALGSTPVTVVNPVTNPVNVTPTSQTTQIGGAFDGILMPPQDTETFCPPFPGRCDVSKCSEVALSLAISNAGTEVECTVFEGNLTANTNIIVATHAGGGGDLHSYIVIHFPPPFINVSCFNSSFTESTSFSAALYCR